MKRFLQYFKETETLKNNLPPILYELYVKYNEKIFEIEPSFVPTEKDIDFIFQLVNTHEFEKSLPKIPISILKSIGSHKDIASFIVKVKIKNGNVYVSDPEIEILDLSPFFIYQFTNILSHELIHYDDYLNGIGKDVIKTNSYEKAIGNETNIHNDHGFFFQNKMSNLNDAFGLNIVIKYDKNADQHLDRAQFINPDNKTKMKRKIAQALNFNKSDEIDSRILFEDEENVSETQLELVKIARQMLKKHPGANAKIFNDHFKLYIH